MPKLAAQVVDHMDIGLGKASVSRFSDGEIAVEVLENVRGSECYILQSTCQPVNDHFMEIMILSDALRRASAASITVVMPYFGYARQDRRVRSSRVPISAKVIADCLTSVGVSRLVTFELHCDQIQGFFHIPVDNLYTTPLMVQHIQSRSLTRPLVVSPDVGGVVRARAVAKCLDDRSNFAIIDKRREGKNKVEVMHLIGDVKDCDCILVDDIVDTAGTLAQAAAMLKEQGARKVYAYCTHAVLSGDAVTRIEQSALDEVVVSDTIPLPASAAASDKISVMSVHKILAEGILRVSHRLSVSSLFSTDQES